MEIGANAGSLYSPTGINGSSGLRFSYLTSASTPIANGIHGINNTKVLSVDSNGDVILVKPKGGGAAMANNGISISTVDSVSVVLGQNVAQTGNPGRLISNREVPLDSNYLIFTTPTPDNYAAGKVGFGIHPGNTGFDALRKTPTTMQVNGSISIFDGNGNSSLFFGEEQFAASSGTLGEWGVQYDSGAVSGLNFWKPFGSTGVGGNNFLFLSDNGNVGIGSTAVAAPANALQITSYPGQKPAGLRFTHLTAVATPVTNPGLGVLAVDSNGDVIYVPKGGGSGSGIVSADNGLNLSSPSNVQLGGTLLHPTNIDLVNTTNNFSFSNSSIPSQLWSLYPNGSARFDVFGANPSSGTGAAYFLNTTFPSATNVSSGFDCRVSASNSGYATGYYTAVSNPAGEGRGFTTELKQDNNQTGVFSYAQSSNSAANTNTGFYGQVINGKEIYGVNLSLDAPGGTTQDIYGFYARTGINNYGSNSNFGLRVEVAGPANPTMGNYGVYASVPSGAGQTSGGSPNGTNFAGYFVGDVVRTGTDNFTSDRNLKQNIDTISNALNTIMQLQPKTFDYKQSSYPHMNLPSGKQYGLIAQDVQTVLPELVNTITNPAILDTAGNVTTPAFTYLGLEYQQLTGIMIRAMQQQQAHINHQDSIINQLTNAINSCCSNTSRTTQAGGLNQVTGNNNQVATTNIQVTTLSDANVVVLNQNQPNPFAEQTVITYNIPQTANAAQLLFYDVNGKQIQNVNITTKGKGQLNVYANDLTNGVYSYTLIVDGQIIDTKKMVKQQ